MNKDQIRDYTLRISQANRSEIVKIVYELADVYLNEALDALNKTEYDHFVENCHQAEKCIMHMINALDTDYELAGTLLAVYSYLCSELNIACARRSYERIKKVQQQLFSLGESFSEIANQDHSESIMQNSQTVYAGLTYGRNQLNESMYDEGARRGYQV